MFYTGMEEIVTRYSNGFKTFGRYHRDTSILVLIGCSDDSLIFTVSNELIDHLPLLYTHEQLSA
jgi:hypothetical protein